jgi:uncharacterized cupin superfamily protein
VTLVHWDDVPGFDIPESVAPLAGTWQRLADAAGSVRVGTQRVRLKAGQLMTPPHTHSAEEEIFFVLDGTATLWQDGKTCTVSAGDTIVFVPGETAHTFIGGDGGFDVLVFGTRLMPEAGALPRSNHAWLGGRAVHFTDAHPWEAEAKLGLPEGEPSDRPPNVVSLDGLEGDYGGIVKHPGKAGGAQRSGLNWLALPPEREGAPPHCHSAEEEVFVVLDGEGTLELWAGPSPGAPHQTEPRELHPLRRGSVVSRPPGTRVPHSIRSGANGLTYLAYGTKDTNDVCYYPRSNKVFWRGLGVIARLELLEYSDGEPS